MEEYTRNPNTFCKICKTAIYRRPCELERSRGSVYCNSACYGKASRKETPCIVCQQPILASKNKKTCSRACANVNRTGIIYRTGARKDKVKTQRALKMRLLEARGKTCERCGYTKVEILHVHHKNRNHNDNSLQNLELICPNCHYEEHYLEKNWLRITS